MWFGDETSIAHWLQQHFEIVLLKVHHDEYVNFVGFWITLCTLWRLGWFAHCAIKDLGVIVNQYLVNFGSMEVILTLFLQELQNFNFSNKF